MTQVEDDLPGDINYLRISITDRCNLRCFYCTPWGGWQKLPCREILRYEELLRLAAVAARVGIRKVRVTGGEPLVRKGVLEFIRHLHRVPGLEEVCLTTNGVLLPEMAPDLYATGLRHLNLSLDTLHRERYRSLTGSDHLPQVLAGIEAAASLGFSPLKINCVVLKGINDDELLEFARLTRHHPFQVRFIEFMPTVSQERWQDHFLPMATVRRRLEKLGPMDPVARTATAGPARTFRLPGYQGELGFISSVSDHHCPTCNRLRLTAAGYLRPCLFAAPELDLKTPLRQGADDEALGRLFREAIGMKKFAARPGAPDCPFPGRAMVGIGG
jgi:cyclic pyranopterin phosphate synthase